MGKCLGVPHDMGQAIKYYELKQFGQIVEKFTVCPLSSKEKNNNQVKTDQEQFISQVEEILNILCSSHLITTCIHDG